MTYNKFLLQIPIIIGTHPVTHGENVVPKYENLAPPAYYSNGYENIGFAPPSYEVSVSGRSEVNDEDDCDYSPLVYHYTCKLHYCRITVGMSLNIN